MAYSPRRYNHFPYISPRCRRSGHLQDTSSAQVNFTKAKLKFSSPDSTAQRPFQGRWLVPMDPNWVHQSHLAATLRRRTAASGTTEFQIRPNSQLQHEYARINRTPEKATEGHTGQIYKLMQIYAAVRAPDTRCGELRGGLSSRVPATATQFRWIIQRNCCALRSGRL